MSLRDYIPVAAEAFGVPQRDITGRARYSRVRDARFALYWVGRDHLGYSFARVGRALDRDHSSVMHGYAEARARMDRDPGYAAAVSHMTDMVPAPSKCPCCHRSWGGVDDVD